MSSKDVVVLIYIALYSLKAFSRHRVFLTTIKSGQSLSNSSLTILRPLIQSLSDSVHLLANVVRLIRLPINYKIPIATYPILLIEYSTIRIISPTTYSAKRARLRAHLRFIDSISYELEGQQLRLRIVILDTSYIALDRIKSA